MTKTTYIKRVSYVTVTKQLITLMRNFNVGYAMTTKVVEVIVQGIATEIASLVTAVMGVADGLYCNYTVRIYLWCC